MVMKTVLFLIFLIMILSLKDIKNKGYYLVGYLRYDFAILDESNIPMRLIEFDGEQHARPIEHFGGENKFKIQQENDVLKNQYALSHNIPLVRIPYSKRDYINLDDILGDKYLIKNSLIVA